jgi:hypothetical protein
MAHGRLTIFKSTVKDAGMKSGATTWRQRATARRR